MRRTIMRVNGRVYKYSNPKAVHSFRFDPPAFPELERDWNEYQNEYQTDSCGYVQTCSDKHGLALKACKMQYKSGHNRSIPTLASIPK